MKIKYDWKQILEIMKDFSKTEDINEITLIGDSGKFRRIELEEEEIE